MNLRKINCPLKNGHPLLLNNSHSFSFFLEAKKDGYFETEISYFHEDWDNWLEFCVFYPDGESLEYMPCLPHGRGSARLPIYLKKGANAITIKHNFGHEILIFNVEILQETSRTSELSPKFETLYLGDEKEVKTILASFSGELQKIVSGDKEIAFYETIPSAPERYRGFRLHHKEIHLDKADLLSLGLGGHKLNFILSNGETLEYNITLLEKKKYALEIVNFNVTCANSTLIRLPNGKNLLVDSSLDKRCEDVILPYLKKHNINVDYYLLTHFHSDHWGKLEEICKLYGIEKPDEKKIAELIKGDNKERLEYLKSFRYLDSTMLRFYDEIGDIWDLGGVKITALNSRFDENGNPMKIHNFYYVKYNEHNFENSTSVSFILRYNDFGYYHGADNYAFSQTRLHEDYKKWGKENELDCQYYYANHHFHCDISADFIRTVNPTVTYVSVDISVYSRSTYAYDYLENVKDYRFSYKRLQDTILSFESGTAIAHVNSGDDWSYETKDNEYL